MMAQLIDRKQLKQEMKELLRSAQVSPRGMTCLYLALVLVLNLADSFMGLMNPGLLGTFISILTGLMSTATITRKEITAKAGVGVFRVLTVFVLSILVSPF